MTLLDGRQGFRELITTRELVTLLGPRSAVRLYDAFNVRCDMAGCNDLKKLSS